MGELARGLQPGHPGHRHVEDREVDVLFQRALNGRGAVVDLVDDAEVGLGVEEVAQPVAHDRVIVGQEDAGDERDAHSSSLLGTCRRTSVPRPLARPIEMFAPTSRARYRMPRSPLDLRSALSGSPTPSSRTMSSTPPSPSLRSVTSARVAPAWRTPFVMLSCATR